ncbi:D-ribose pyranase [Thorsellia anophelis]|uniref:D-ribose pyranase n=1 Tax=Thorsellia anophelis DSM 18579 TaxID=1123402 RepID=A0A1I0AFH2_9GAMM|nr:D-ribose pyranase [Thorsellia anophelis]SES92989.1 ribose transport protein RbsD [Thorsellia anophelis DSM 18579]
MKKGPLLNAQLSHEIALLGHTDRIVIADAGLPIPQGVTRIDLALTQNVPGFIQTLSIILAEMVVERVTLANELRHMNPNLFEEVETLIIKTGIDTNQEIEIEYCSHDHFKHEVMQSGCVVRTGECSPFANIILHAGVTF